MMIWIHTHLMAIMELLENMVSLLITTNFSLILFHFYIHYFLLKMYISLFLSLLFCLGVIMNDEIVHHQCKQVVS
jgi:hypothetical protein